MASLSSVAKRYSFSSFSCISSIVKRCIQTRPAYDATPKVQRHQEESLARVKAEYTEQDRIAKEALRKWFISLFPKVPLNPVKAEIAPLFTDNDAKSVKKHGKFMEHLQAMAVSLNKREPITRTAFRELCDQVDTPLLLQVVMRVVQALTYLTTEPGPLTPVYMIQAAFRLSVQKGVKLFPQSELPDSAPSTDKCMEFFKFAQSCHALRVEKDNIARFIHEVTVHALATLPKEAHAAQVHIYEHFKLIDALIGMAQYRGKSLVERQMFQREVNLGLCKFAIRLLKACPTEESEAYRIPFTEEPLRQYLANRILKAATQCPRKYGTIVSTSKASAQKVLKKDTTKLVN